MANAKGSGLGKCEYDFAENQPWCRTSHNLSFIDETRELVSIYDRDSDPETNNVPTPIDWGGSTRSAPEPSSATLPPPRSRPAPLRTNSNSIGTPGINELSSPTKRRRLTGELESPFPFSDVFQGSPELNTGILQHSPIVHDSPVLHHSPGEASHHRRVESYTSTSVRGGTTGNPLDTADGFDALNRTASITSDFATGFSAVSETLSKIYLDAPIWPLQDREEAQLMRYFTEVLARSFDLCDQDRHFALVVPQRAAICPTLLNAIFAASARHLSRISDFDPFVSDRYHQECLKHLIPELSDTAAIMDENLLAATIILRFLEEVEGKPCKWAPMTLTLLLYEIPHFSVACVFAAGPVSSNCFC